MTGPAGMLSGRILSRFIQSLVICLCNADSTLRDQIFTLSHLPLHQSPIGPILKVKLKNTGMSSSGLLIDEAVAWIDIDGALRRITNSSGDENKEADYFGQVCVDNLKDCTANISSSKRERTSWCEQTTVLTGRESREKRMCFRFILLEKLPGYAKGDRRRRKA